jgi:hypothetical protein
MWKCDPVFGDVNGDGFLDLAAVPRLGDGPHVWLGNGGDGWTDNDGYLDLAVADHCQGVFVYLGDGTGQWGMVTRQLYPRDAVSDSLESEMVRGAEDIAVGDVNGDGFMDLVAGGSDRGGINVYLGNGTGREWTRKSEGLPSAGWANRVMLYDINGDERLDIVASHSEGPRVWLNGGEGGWKPASDWLPRPVIAGLYSGIAVGDVNHDGRADIATANWVDGPEVYLQEQDGSWQKTADVFPEMRGGATGLAFGDIDRDGHADLIVSGRLEANGGYVRGVFLLRGDGTGGWAYVRHSGLPDTGLAATPGVALGDVNGDGILDVAAASGLIVETAPGPTEPVLPTRMLVWITKLALPAATGKEPAR